MIYVIDYSTSPSINSKRQKRSHSRFLLRDEPFSPKFQNHITSLFLNQITSHKAQNSSFFILFHLHRSKLPKKSFKWQNHQRSERAFRLHPQSSELEVTDHPRCRQPKFLPPYHLLRCFPRKNNVSDTIPFSLLVPLSTLSL